MSKHGLFGFVLGLGVGAAAATVLAQKTVNKVHDDLVTEKDKAVVEGIHDIAASAIMEVRKFMTEATTKINEHLAEKKEEAAAEEEAAKCPDFVDVDDTVPEEAEEPEELSEETSNDTEETSNETEETEEVVDAEADGADTEEVLEEEDKDTE